MGAGCRKQPKEKKEDLQAKPSSEKTNKHDSVALESTKTGTNVTTEPGTYHNETTEPVSEIISPNQVKPKLTETKADANDTNEPETNNAAKISQASPSGELPMTMDSTKTCTNGTNKPEENNIDTIEQTPTTDASGSEQDNPQSTVTKDSTETCTNGTNKPEDNVGTIEKTPTTDATGSEQDNPQQTVAMDSTETCTNGTTKPEENNIDTIEKTPTTDATGSEQDNPQLTVTVDLTNTCANGSNEPKENHIETVEQTPTLQATGSEQDSQQLTNVHGSSQSSPTAERARAHSNGASSLASGSSKDATSEKLQEPNEVSQNVQIELKRMKQDNEILKHELDETKKKLEKERMEKTQMAEKKDTKKVKQKDLNRQYQDALMEKEKLKEDLRKEKKEKEEVLLRLSAEAASKLTHNNPQVTDLSDENRATKLSEKFSELYDNQWTDAFEALVKDGKHSDREAIDILLKTLLICRKSREYDKYFTLFGEKLKKLKIADTCIGKSTQDWKRLKAIISEFGGDDKDGALTKGLLERRKHRFGHTLQELTTSIQENLDADGTNVLNTSPTYIEHCIKLCWLMAIQDPPLHIGRPDTLRNGQFDKGLFKSYTRDGDKIDYVVWPALFLHDDGPLLSKGVAQAKGTQTEDNREVGSFGTTTPPVDIAAKESGVTEEADEQKPDEPQSSSTTTSTKDDEHVTTQELTHDAGQDVNTVSGKNSPAPEESTVNVEIKRSGIETQVEENIVQNDKHAKEEPDEPPSSPTTPPSLGTEHETSVDEVVQVQNGDEEQGFISKSIDGDAEHDPENPSIYENNTTQEQLTTDKQNTTEVHSKESLVQDKVKENGDGNSTGNTKEIENAASVKPSINDQNKLELTTIVSDNQDSTVQVAMNSTDDSDAIKEDSGSQVHSVNVSNVHADELPKLSESPKNKTGEYKEKSTDAENVPQMAKAKRIKDNKNEKVENASSKADDIGVSANKTTEQKTDKVDRDQVKSSASYVLTQKRNLESKSQEKDGDYRSRSTWESSNRKQADNTAFSNESLKNDASPRISDEAKTVANGSKAGEYVVKEVVRTQDDVHKLEIGNGGSGHKNVLPASKAVSNTDSEIVYKDGKHFPPSSGASKKSDSNRSSTGTNFVKNVTHVTSTKPNVPGQAQGHTTPANKGQDVKIGALRNLKETDAIRGNMKGNVRNKSALFSGNQ